MLSNHACRRLLAFALLVLVGCGEPGLPQVTGVVSLDGRPVDKGSISFIPENGQGPTTGAEIVAGRYTSEAPLGVSKVEIRVPKVVGKKKLYNTPDSPVQDVMEELLPEKYNEQTELRFDAQPGRNEKNWDLQTKSPAPS